MRIHKGIQTNPILDISKLRIEVQHRENRKYKTFEKVLDICYQKIITTNKTSSECCCIFICPQVIFGLPLFNLIECIKFIMINLVDKGFETHLALPNQIFISWQNDSEKKAQLITNYYKLDSTQHNLQLEYNKNNSNNNKNKNNNNNSNSNSKLFMNKIDNTKQYKPIDDYKQQNTTFYDNNEIDIFRNKIDNLLN